MKKKRGFRLLLYFALLILLLLVMGPFLWMILASLKTQAQILDTKNLFVFHPVLDNYLGAFARYNFLKPLLNSAAVALLSTFFALILGVPAAYSIGRFNMGGMGMVILAARIIPGLLFLLPWFILLSKMRLVDTLASLVLTHMLVALPLTIWITLPGFETFPRELEDAARIDGCNHYSTFARIVLPLTVPTMVTAAIMSVIYSWNNFMFALVLTGSRSKTLPVAIFNFIEYAQINWGGLMAASVVITFPIIILVLTLQRYVVSGSMTGSLKG